MLKIPAARIVEPAPLVTAPDTASVRVAEMLTPVALVEVLIRVVRPVRLPLLTRSRAVPVLVKLLVAISDAGVTVNVP